MADPFQAALEGFKAIDDQQQASNKRRRVEDRRGSGTNRQSVGAGNGGGGGERAARPPAANGFPGINPIVVPREGALGPALDFNYWIQQTNGGQVRDADIRQLVQDALLNSLGALSGSAPWLCDRDGQEVDRVVLACASGLHIDHVAQQFANGECPFLSRTTTVPTRHTDTVGLRPQAQDARSCVSLLLWGECPVPLKDAQALPVTDLFSTHLVTLEGGRGVVWRDTITFSCTQTSTQTSPGLTNGGEGRAADQFAGAAGEGGGSEDVCVCLGWMKKSRSGEKGEWRLKRCSSSSEEGQEQGREGSGESKSKKRKLNDESGNGNGKGKGKGKAAERFVLDLKFMKYDVESLSVEIAEDGALTFVGTAPAADDKSRPPTPLFLQLSKAIPTCSGNSGGVDGRGAGEAVAAGEAKAAEAAAAAGGGGGGGGSSGGGSDGGKGSRKRKLKLVFPCGRSAATAETGAPPAQQASGEGSEGVDKKSGEDAKVKKEEEEEEKKEEEEEKVEVDLSSINVTEFALELQDREMLGIPVSLKGEFGEYVLTGEPPRPGPASPAVEGGVEGEGEDEEGEDGSVSVPMVVETEEEKEAKKKKSTKEEDEEEGESEEEGCVSEAKPASKPINSHVSFLSSEDEDDEEEGCIPEPKVAAPTPKDAGTAVQDGNNGQKSKSSSMGSNGTNTANGEASSDRKKRPAFTPPDASRLPACKRGLKLVGVDCEMVSTANGMRLARVSMVNARGEVIYDELVKPGAKVTDHNTEFSGITEEMLRGATLTLRDVQRQLGTILDDKTYLVGHSLDSDMRALKIVHPHIIDTAALYPSSRGAPFKRSLKQLSKELLGRQIQDSNAGHDSVQDATSTMQLALLKMIRGHEYALPEPWEDEADGAMRVPLFGVLLRNNHKVAAAAAAAGLDTCNGSSNDDAPSPPSAAAAAAAAAAGGGGGGGGSNRPVRCRVFGDECAGSSDEFSRLSTVWAKASRGYRREGDSIFTAKRAAAAAAATAAAAAAAAGGSGDGMAPDGGLLIRTCLGAGEAVREASAALKENTNGAELIYMDLPCSTKPAEITPPSKSASAPSASGNGEGGSERDMEGGEEEEGMVSGQEKEKLLRSCKEIDAAAAALYAAMPAKSLLVVVYQSCLKEMRDLAATKTRTRWSLRARDSNQQMEGIKGGVSPWREQDEACLYTAAGHALNGVTFLALK